MRLIAWGDLPEAFSLCRSLASQARAGQGQTEQRQVDIDNAKLLK